MQKIFLQKLVPVLLLIFQLLINDVVARTRSLPAVPTNNLAAITERELRMHLSFLASPELGGRYSFSDGNRIAARYLASQLESFGYRGAAKGGEFFQNIEFFANFIDVKNSQLKIITNNTNLAPSSNFTYGKDFFTPSAVSFSITAPVVFVGYGISLPQQDDYAKLDVKDKIVLVSSTIPKSLSREVNSDQYGAGAAFAHGAKAVLFLPQDDSSRIRGNPSIENEDLFQMAKPGESKLLINQEIEVEIGLELAKTLLGTINLSIEDFFNIELAGKEHTQATLPLSIDLKLVSNTVTKKTQNVAAIFEGTDPKLKQEYVLLSAHYDHIKSEGKQVFCGADDDASGTSAILTIARILSLTPPKRSILIVFHTAEEIGLYGSHYFTDIEPLVSLESIVVNLNADMIGRSRTEKNSALMDRELTDKDSLYLIGSDKHSSELHKLSEQTNSEITGLRINYTYNAENHPSRLFYRSDHYNYAKKGIPIIFYFTGLHSDYHRSTDTIEKIDFEKLTRISRLIYATAWRVSNLEKRLVIDRWKEKSN
ncbi:MAG: M28 family peptidase [Acidobacteria bacterium]|nr:M28 family peptidase [Acidobacteriota bacterium]